MESYFQPLNCGHALINFNQRWGIAFKIKIYCQFAANSIKLRPFCSFLFCSLFLYFFFSWSSDTKPKPSRKNTQLDMDKAGRKETGPIPGHLNPICK